MPLTYPLALADFADILPISSLSFHLPEQVVMSRNGKGEVLTADVGERLWQGRMTLGRLTRAEAGRPEVLIELVRGGAQHSFLIYDRHRTNPRLDPQGAILGASAVTILALGGDARELSLAGLPAGYVLSAGDHLSFAYGSGLQALHRIVTTTVTASGAGQTPLFEVIPAIRPGAVAGASVQLKKAYCKAVAMPGSIEEAVRFSTLSEGMSFDWVQTLR
ncbi:MAG: hypothetical protein MUE52_04475 [Tabrizicola sp.]|jgi:hypothetical protein|nr:hypothetical protein [Tabrizicola sp.]